VQVAADGHGLRYDAPDGVLTDAVLDQLRRHKPELLAWLAGTDPAGRVVDRALPPYIQQEVWHRNRTHPCPVVYTVAQRISLDGPIDPAALRAALRWLVERHEALRTRFTSYRDGADEQPVLEVFADVPVRLPVTDLTGLPEPDRAAALDRECAAEMGLPFPLDRAPLWRARLFVLDRNQHLLLWTMHHIICDGWSIGILLEEFLAAYAAIGGSGSPPERPPVELTNAGYARWQRRHLSGERLAALAASWREELAGAPMTIALPYDGTPPPRLSGRGAVHHLTFPPATTQRLRETARRLRTTPYALALSAFALLLAEVSGQDDLVIVTSYANRDRPGHEGVVGFVADRLPIRIRLRGARTAGGIAERVGAAVFAAVDRALPLSLIVPALPAAQRPPPPYPAVLFTLLDLVDQSRDTGEVRVAVAPDSVEGVARMRLYCFLGITATGLRGGFEYSTDLFHPETIAAWGDRFLTLLAPPVGT
jgi:hypothetical protein